MKKTIKTMLALMAGTLTFCACSSDDAVVSDKVNTNADGAKLVTLTAYQEDNVLSRAAIDATTRTQINWSKDDKISYFGGNLTGSKTSEYMTLVGDGGSATGTFSGTVTTGTTDYVLYPKTDAAYLSSNGSTYSLQVSNPTTQYAVKDNFDPNAAIMVGAVNNGTVQFKNACSFLKLTTTAAYTKIVVTGTNIARSVINPSTGEPYNNDTFAQGASFIENITLLPPSGSDNIATGTYYIAIAPTNKYSDENYPSPTVIDEGVRAFSIHCYTDASTYVEKVASYLPKFVRNKVYDMGTTEGWATPSISGTAKATISGSEVDVYWVQLWPGGPKFATKNVGFTDSDIKGTAMTADDANKTGSDFVWGNNWKLLDVADLGKYFGRCQTSYFNISSSEQNGVKGLLLTGTADGYTSQTLFLPLTVGPTEHNTQPASFITGSTTFWGLKDGTPCRWVGNYDTEDGGSHSLSIQDVESGTPTYYVRPVLKE